MKIIASDYDGTLNCHGITDSLRASLVKWQKTGNKFGIVSGRGIYNISAVAKKDNIKCDFFVANNGAVIADGEGKPFKVFEGNSAVTIPLCGFILENAAQYACINDTVGEVFVTTTELKGEKFANDERFVLLSELQERSFTQISTICDSSEAAEVLTEKINLSFGESVIAFRNGICIDIVPVGVNKAEGIRVLISLLGASEADVCAVGDNQNDIPMLEAFKSYAVENATDEVKAIASYTVYDVQKLIERELEG